MSNMAGIEFKAKEIECNFTYLYNDDLSLVIDIIRHYGRIVFRGFAITRGARRDFGRMFPFPAVGEPPFSGKSNQDRVIMDLERNTIVGHFEGEPRISFQLAFSIDDAYFSSTTPDWLHSVPFLRDLYGLTDLTKALSLLHEDFPLVTFSGIVKVDAREYRLSCARGSIAHHWGWWFPDYIFLMCNAFEDLSMLLTLSYVDATTRLGTSLKSGYLYLRQQGRETRLVSPFQGNVMYFREGGQLSVIVRFDEEETLRVNIDPRRGVPFPHTFNTDSVTVLNAVCEVEGVGKSDKAVLDMKGLHIIKEMEALLQRPRRRKAER